MDGIFCSMFTRANFDIQKSQKDHKYLVYPFTEKENTFIPFIIRFNSSQIYSKLYRNSFSSYDSKLQPHILRNVIVDTNKIMFIMFKCNANRDFGFCFIFLHFLFTSHILSFHISLSNPFYICLSS